VVEAVWKRSDEIAWGRSIRGTAIKRYVEGWDRRQTFLLPESVDDFVGEDNPVRVIEVFVDELDLSELGFARATPAETGRPAYHPALLLKLYLYGYLNRVPSSRRLEREAQRNLEVLWLTGRLSPDFKTIADFRRDNGPAIKATCRQFGSVSSRAIWAALDDKLSGCLRGLHDAERNSGCFGEAGATGGCRNGLAVTTTTTEQITEFAILSAEAPG
jgi:transposase